MKLSRSVSFAVLIVFSAGAWAGVELLRNINTTVIPQSSDPRILGKIGTRVYFTATDNPGSRYSMWRTDGTPAGTEEVPELAHLVGVDSSVIEFPGRLVFSAFRNGVSQIWATDGTSAGTTQLPPTDATGGMALLGVLANGRAVYEVGFGPTDPLEMWSTDGTVAGTERILTSSNWARTGSESNRVVGNTFYYYGADDTTGFELWRTDGTAAGTRIVRDI